MTQADTVELGERFFTDPHELYRILRHEAPVGAAEAGRSFE